MQRAAPAPATPTPLPAGATSSSASFVKEKEDGGSEEDPYLVRFAAGDLANPRNWPTWKKVLTIGCISTNAFIISLMASAYLFVSETAKVQFDSTTNVATLGFVLYVMMWGASGLLLSPLSDQYGRKYVLSGSSLLWTLFHVSAARAANMQTLLVCRALAGLTGSASMVLGASVSVEMFTGINVARGSTLFMLNVFLGPVLGPCVGGIIASFAKPIISDDAGWRIVFYIAIVAGTIFTVIYFTIYPESHHATILRQRARQLRQQHSDKPYATEIERQGSITLVRKLAAVITTAATMLVSEPVILFIALWQVVITGVVYSFFDSAVVVYGPGGHNFAPWQIGLTFLGMGVGMLLASCTCLTLELMWYVKQTVKRQGSLPPELRIPPAIIYSCICFCGLFTFAGTTSSNKIHWSGPVIASGIFAFGFLNLINSTFLYLVDTFGIRSGSAVAAVGLVRCVATSAFPLFSTQFYRNVGPQNATIILACVCVAMTAIPPIAYKYGVVLRGMSKYAIKG
ncbi:MFS general substrate transporter [Tilletiaria anomala UBC 951]|uniref:MFS general substrate transporter n=1 Tax=Tilletiaria anomala (strain ATCC 24038 / CBS 436.72 / UBC 951) TaxID=1037660 RepID=A0A066VWC3_TILAU|nr:MFS general substrate transporter [Tilletiaria anomala UBC 951]KDN43114.1 MFS general substrate transporter [Tilletiaria anomala UBC 951]